ncbi:hypothetical protein [Parafrankia discariae]|uniref:hypothetical protein n=1 Tax=Parafrankia discariae TaxID=365528 RepID=UPI00037F5AE7|nr:hypothetical protein [Parafrankia discariae]
MNGTAPETPGRYGSAIAAVSAYDALRAAQPPIDRAIAHVIGTAQNTTPADRLDQAGRCIAEARAALDRATAELAQLREAASRPVPPARRSRPVRRPVPAADRTTVTAGDRQAVLDRELTNAVDSGWRVYGHIRPARPTRPVRP